MSTFVGHAPQVQITRPDSVTLTDVTHIPCPYCRDGAAVIAVEKGGAEKIRIEGFREPRKCDSCGKYFRLAARVVVQGVRIEE